MGVSDVIVRASESHDQEIRRVAFVALGYLVRLHRILPAAKVFSGVERQRVTWVGRKFFVMNRDEKWDRAKWAWRRPAEVPSDSGVGERLSLMNLFTSSSIGLEEFASRWYVSRRRSMNAKERVREPFDVLLEGIFFALEDMDDDDNLTADHLHAQVHAVLSKLMDL
ncbi:hypothetical protein ACTWPB_02810 [Nocardia sp. IBHARD005]|uniref:hypothetical protein n=1 Tax=Nocardia sp. IBHARD005 TaxID=3457765 RepID=UPI004058439B